MGLLVGGGPGGESGRLRWGEGEGCMFWDWREGVSERLLESLWIMGWCCVFASGVLQSTLNTNPRVWAERRETRLVWEYQQEAWGVCEATRKAGKRLWIAIGISLRIA